GPYGTQVVNNVKSFFRKNLVQLRDDVVEQNGSIITNPKVWEASGHLSSFGDFILTTKKSKTKLRADHFIEDALGIPTDGMGAKEIKELIKKNNLKYKGEEFEEIKDFNLLFPVRVGADESNDNIAYLRGETCQSVFPNFKLVQEVTRQKLPFGILQIGKSFRNEIAPRDFLFRLREFEQIELEYFFNPKKKFEIDDKDIFKIKFNFLSSESQENNEDKTEMVSVDDLISKNKLNEVHGYWLGKIIFLLHKKLGINLDNLRVREHVSSELSHYSAGTFDIDYKYPFGFKEMVGITNRTDYDLKQHQKFSKSKLDYFDDENKEKIIPHVIEPSLGVERVFLALLYEGYFENDKGEVILKLPVEIAPVKLAIFPLVKNDKELVGLSEKIYSQLREDFNVSYDVSGSIGRRYARNDEIGTPYCITVDGDSVINKDVTIRERDSTKQVRVGISELKGVLNKLVKKEICFENLVE
ncbi:MAG: glycine--tRNA ligase, partial [Candidatus Pacearchaeota archaeon]|nr:glycine--tRNA ligase [Candidatus Pacearchaeota archaeon]